MATVAKQDKQKWIIASDSVQEITKFQIQILIAKNLARWPIDFFLYLQTLLYWPIFEKIKKGCQRANFFAISVWNFLENSILGDKFHSVTVLKGFFISSHNI